MSLRTSSFISELSFQVLGREYALNSTASVSLSGKKEPINLDELNRTQPDFVFVFNTSGKSIKKLKVNGFIRSLERKGFVFTGQNAETTDDLLFILCYAPHSIVFGAAFIFNINLAYEKKEESFLPEDPIFPVLYTPLTSISRLRINNRIREAYMETLNPTSIRSSERIMIVEWILQNTTFGVNKGEIGLMGLLNSGYLQAAYPLHDGSYKWSSTGSLNDRQLLYKYWALMNNYLKVQPIDLIYKYYGAEVAFFFAFLRYLCKMYLCTSIAGAVSTLYGLSTLNTKLNQMSKDICNSDSILCPTCLNQWVCKYKKIKFFCESSHYTYIIDNLGSFLYSIFICFWAATLVILWKRNEAKLKFKWDLFPKKEYPLIRPQFVTQAKNVRVSTYTGTIEADEPLFLRNLKVVLSFFVMFLFVCFIMCATLTALLVKQIINLYWLTNVPQTNFLLLMLPNMIMLISMLIFEKVCLRVAKYMTDFENPRTKDEYDRSFIYKAYILSFANSYFYIAYASIFRGRFHSTPDNLGAFFTWTAITNDVCGPCGCTALASVQLAFIVIGKTLFKASAMIVKPMVIPYIKYYFTKKDSAPYNFDDLNQWECEYYCMPSDDFFLLDFQIHMMIMYGYVVLFATTLPILAVYILVYSSLMLRAYAFVITRFYRRPVPKFATSFVAWNKILQTLTYIGIATNGAFLAINVNFIPSFMARLRVDDYANGYFNYTMSEFAVKDIDPAYPFKIEESVCYYEAKRYPPGHPNQYELTGFFYRDLSYRLLFVLAFEGIIILFASLMFAIFPTTPKTVKEQLLEKERKMHELKKQYFKPQDKMI